MKWWDGGEHQSRGPWEDHITEGQESFALRETFKVKINELLGYNLLTISFFFFWKEEGGL